MLTLNVAISLLDCTLCVAECPVDAIFAEDDVPVEQRPYIAVNAELGSSPEKVNEDAFAAWMFRMKPANPTDVDKLLDAAAYEKAAAA